MRQLKLLFVVLTLSIAVFAAESPFSGTWRLNLGKSKMTPRHPKEAVAHVNADDSGIKVTDDVTDNQGQTIKISYEAKFDGKDYPATGAPDFDSVSFQRVNSNTLKAKTKKAGKVVGEYTIVVSEGGKTTTVKYTEADQESSAVYDRQ